jgi:predicted RNA-binding Zn ribbon-like protein
MNNDWRSGFLFVGNQLLLDFINTRPRVDGREVELLPDGRALARWLGAAGLVSEREAAQLMRRWTAPRYRRAIRELRQFRERAREAVFKMEYGEHVSRGALKSLNQLLMAYPQLCEVVQTRIGFVRQRHFAPTNPEHVFAALADAFAALLTATPMSRVRKCDGCPMHFYDTSKKGTRIWCSMKLCGNRAKVAAFANRERAARRAKTSVGMSKPR